MISEEKIAQIANEHFMDSNQLTRHQFINFGRAIEAECRGVPEYVWMIGTKGFMALFATEEAANDWQQMNGTNTPASYIQPVSIPVISAAPKPDPERKHEIVPTLAEPDCECGAVASEHCPACEPVAQEYQPLGPATTEDQKIYDSIAANYSQPVAQEPFGIWHVGDTEEESDFFLFKDSGDVSCPRCIKLYTAPPDLAAEVERLREYHEGYKEEVMDTIEELRRQQAVLVEALEKLARLGNGEHYGNSDGNCIAIAALASVKEDNNA